MAFVQRFDSGLRLNVHFHVIWLDGVYSHEPGRGGAEEALEIADEPPPDGVASRKWLAKKRLQVKTRFWLMSRWFPQGRER